MDSLLVLFIIWAVGKGLGNRKKKSRSINQTLKSMPVQKDPFEERQKQKPMTGEEIQARKQALKAQYAEKLAEKKQAAANADSIAQPAAAAGAFGVAPLKPLEGVDPCHDELYQAEKPSVKAAEAQDESEWQLNLAFDRQQLVQAVVMQEILTRPCQRQRRGFR